jgi:ATP-dependent DNA ligase
MIQLAGDERAETGRRQECSATTMTLPRVQPIVPTSRKEPFDDPEWLFELKYDGFRALCYLEQGRCHFISRRGNHMRRFDELGDHLAAVLDVNDAILDGEVIAADETGRPQFYDLLRRARAPAYVTFDMLWADTVPTCALCRSASAGSGCKRCCRRDRRSCPRRCRSRAEDGSSSI